MAYNKVGDVQMAQGNLPAALKSYQVEPRDPRASRQIYPGNARWQRDLSVSYENVGDVQMAQGDLPAALKSYQAGLAIRERLAKSDARQCRLATRSVGFLQRRIGDVQRGTGRLDRRAEILSGQASRYRASRQERSRQCLMAARSVGVLR